MNYHPVDEIKGDKSSELNGVNVALCVTGSVAAYKAIDLARELIKRGANVRFIATRQALKFVTKTLMHWASGLKPIVEGSGETEHIAVAGRSGWANIVVVAPATANTICKLANGVSDNVVMDVLTTALGSGKPIVVAPSMHFDMYNSPIVKSCIEKLKSMRIAIAEPYMENGRLKMAPIDEITDLIEDVLNPIPDLRGLKVLVTAGPTREYLDPVRFMSNASSGRMGYAFASLCINNGACVYLVSGPTEVKPPRGVNLTKVNTTSEMLEKCIEIANKVKPDLAILAAAPADFQFEVKFSDKVNSSMSLNLTLKPTPKIAKSLRELLPKSVIIGFKAEYGVSDEELLRRAEMRMKEYGLDLVVANDVSKPGVGFGSELNEGYLISKSGISRIERMNKRSMARLVLRRAVELLRR